jgi:hypothetical protein
MAKIIQEKMVKWQPKSNSDWKFMEIIRSNSYVTKWRRKCSKVKTTIYKWCNIVSHFRKSIIYYANNIQDRGAPCMVQDMVCNSYGT